jgi:predicted ATPase
MPLVRQRARKYNLPARLAPTIGRARSICALVDRVLGRRLVTIVGPGGSGKTTVAVGVANTLVRTLTEVWRHGVCFVDLASITEPRLVPHALASALGITPAAEDPSQDILASLSKRSVLLLLDNCEHVLESSARIAERILRHAPHVHVLATSREPLRAMEESVYDLAPLDVPPDGGARTPSQLLAYSAIRLFVERAGADADVRIGDEDLFLVAHICRRLAGNALAIEIAAAHARLLGLKALAAGLPDELYLSISGLNTAEPRHRTLRATLDWSYGLLSPGEQAIYRRLSRLVDDFDLDRVLAAVADLGLTRAAVFASVTSLARKSLIVADVAGEKAMYRLHDLSRAHAREKLLESEVCASELSGVRAVG